MHTFAAFAFVFDEAPVLAVVYVRMCVDSQCFLSLALSLFEFFGI